MSNALSQLFESMSRQAGHRGLSRRDWAVAAGVRPETLSRLTQRGDCDLNTVARLAAAVGLEVSLRSALAREMPKAFGREEEDRLLELCASGSTDVGRWLRAGPPYFMAGLAVLVAGQADVDRKAMLMLAEALHPGMTSPEEYSRWLESSPLRPSRFLPMRRARVGAKRRLP